MSQIQFCGFYELAFFLRPRPGNIAEFKVITPKLGVFIVTVSIIASDVSSEYKNTFYQHHTRSGLFATPLITTAKALELPQIARKEMRIAFVHIR